VDPTQNAVYTESPNMRASRNPSWEAVANPRESVQSFVTNPYAPLPESVVLLLNPYGDPDQQPPSGSRYSFSSATNEPRELIRQDVHPLSTDETTPASVPASRSKRYGPQSHDSTRNRTDVPNYPTRAPTRRSVRDAVRDISGDTLLEQRLEAPSEELQIHRMPASFTEPDPTLLYPKRSDTKYEGGVASPLESVKHLLFDLKDLPDNRNPFVTTSQGERGEQVEQSDAVVNNGLSKRQTFRIVDLGQQARSSYAAQHTARVKESPSPLNRSVAKPTRTASLIDAIGRSHAAAQYVTDSLRARP
jgi:hypothetical protein